MKKLKSKVLLTIIFLVSLYSSGFACDYCLLSQGISPLDTLKGAGIRINERYTVLDKVYRGTEKIANPGVKEEYLTTELTGFYSITGDMMLLAVVPFKKNRMSGELSVMPDGSVEAMSDMKGDDSGLGDVAILGRYTFLRKHTLDSTTTIACLFGIKLPTGKTNSKTEDGMEFLDSHLQLGTGSTDFLAGLSFNHTVQRFSLSANLLGTVTTEGKTGDKDHKFGNMLNYDITAKYRVHPGTAIGPVGPQLFLALGLNGELRAREKEEGVRVDDSGGNTIYLSPGIQVVVAPHWAFEFSYQHAIYHNLNGTQLGENYKAIGGVTYLF